MFSMCVCCFLDGVASSTLCISRVGLSRTNGYDIWTGNKQQAEIARNLEPLASAWLPSIFAVYGSCLAGAVAGDITCRLRLRIGKASRCGNERLPSQHGFCCYHFFFFSLLLLFSTANLNIVCQEILPQRFVSGMFKV